MCDDVRCWAANVARERARVRRHSYGLQPEAGMSCVAPWPAADHEGGSQKSTNLFLFEQYGPTPSTPTQFK